ncbi:MAG: glycosyltransferase family 2 protein, partial [Pseudomonadota bacterium]|nr:glycosyltransferase family 2 protein [Pseudomonadota bacterium]
MKISIIIPVYNISSYIYQCLESVINQTYKNIEIIIVDDGSTDFSGVICSSFAKKDKRIKLIRKQNEGLAEARKTGIKSSTGEYIFNLDGDDWISKECIKDFVDSIEENDTDIVINSFYKEFVGEIHHVKNHFQEGFYDENKIKKIILPELISSKNYFSHGISTYLWGKLFKKDLLIGHQLSVPSEFSVGEDAVVTFPYIADCKSLTIIDKPNYFYRQRAQSMLKTINKNKQELKYIESLTNYLSSRLTGFDFNQQISEYKYNLAMIRTGCFFNNRNLFDTFEIEFPTNKNIGI